MKKHVFIFVITLIGTILAVPLPMPEPEAKVKLYYYPSPTEPTEIIYNNLTSLQNANLKPATKTILLMDGFQSFLYTPMYIDTTKLFAGRSDLNVIVVDWGAYSGYRIRTDNEDQYAALYGHVMTNEMPKMALELADFLKFVSEHNNISFKDMTLIGLSLGCHAAGQTGRALKLKHKQAIGRIVAEDASHQFSPAEIPFRLRQGDADVIESYITDREFLGDMNHSIGNVAIFVNGGANQPCDPNGPTPPPGFFPCMSHVYSYKLYNYLDGNDTIRACPCRGAACLCQGCSFECGDDGIPVGPHMPKSARGTYHLKTGFLDWS